MIGDEDPFSRAPFAGSVSDRPWVQRNATLFSAKESWSILKALVVFLLVVFAVPLVFIYYGIWITIVFVYLFVAALVVRAWTRRPRRRGVRAPLS